MLRQSSLPSNATLKEWLGAAAMAKVPLSELQGAAVKGRAPQEVRPHSVVVRGISKGGNNNSGPLGRPASLQRCMNASLTASATATMRLPPAVAPWSNLVVVPGRRIKGIASLPESDPSTHRRRPRQPPTPIRVP